MVNYALAVWTAGVVYAVLFEVPPVEGLGEFVRIAFLHIPAAWVSVIAFFLAAWRAFRYLVTRQIEHDWWSASSVKWGLNFCLLAVISGAVFAKMTWGAYWNWDPRQTTIFMLLLIYGAYSALRSSIDDPEQRARLSACYAIFASCTVPFLVFIIPRHYPSLHPEPIINGAGTIAMDPVIVYVLAAAIVACTGIFWRLTAADVEARKKCYRRASAAKEMMP